MDRDILREETKALLVVVAESVFGEVISGWVEFEIYASFSRESGKINLGRVNFIPRPTIFPQISFRSLFAPDDSIRFLFFEMKSEWKYSRRRALPW